MAIEAHGNDLVRVVALLAAGVVAVPVFRRLGLGSVLGYLAAGLAIGPFGLRLFTDPQAILHVAELGVVMFLFVIGLEMQPSRLWRLRGRDLRPGRGAGGWAAALLLALACTAAGLAPAVAFIAAMGFVLSSTAIVMQILDERGDVRDAARPAHRLHPAARGPRHRAAARPGGVARAAATGGGAALAGDRARPRLDRRRWRSPGRYLLNPLFRVLAAAKAREVMTAAALLVVLGAALLMQLGGLSMAMGAFLAGVLLSESTFRHQLEADVEPFRGILLGLFFLGVGMSLDLSVFARDWLLILGGTAGADAAQVGGRLRRGAADLRQAPRERCTARC